MSTDAEVSGDRHRSARLPGPLVAFESTTFKALRPGQREVLSAYAANHLETPDLAIEMPTGEGKTLIALLIADWALDQGRSVAYLTGTRQLAERVEEEAERLGLDAVRFAAKDYGGAKLDDYHQAQAVGVMNYWVYFNSKPVPKPADLVIFDIELWYNSRRRHSGLDYRTPLQIRNEYENRQLAA